MFALHQNYPNPFNPNTEIEFDIPEVTKVDISVFNLMGQKVKTLKNEKITPGYHTVHGMVQTIMEYKFQLVCIFIHFKLKLKVQ